MENEQINKIKFVSEDSFYIEELKKRNIKAFEFVFNKYYKDLVYFCRVFFNNQEDCEDLVQDIFVRLWENREHFEIRGSLKSYLMTAVKNNSLEKLKHENVIRNYQDYAIAHNNSFDYDVDNYILYSELNQQLQKELDKLPKEMREVFEMHRFKNKKYHEIANELNVSVRTIENRISKVLEVLRKKMEGFYDFILCFFTLLSH